MLQEKIEIIVTEIMVSIDILQFQLMTMTGTTVNLDTTEKPTGMMTTKRPGMS